MECENARLLKELDRIQAEHRVTIHKQANANKMLIKEYKKQNVVLQNALVDSKSMEIKRGDSAQRLSDEAINKDSDGENAEKRMKKLRTISNTPCEGGSFAESPFSSPSSGNGKRKRGKRGRGRRSKRTAYQFSPALRDSRNTRQDDVHTNQQKRMSIKRSISTNDSRDCPEDNENRDPSLAHSTLPNQEDSNSSPSTTQGEPERKRLARSGRVAKQYRNIQKPIKKEVSFIDSDESVLGQERSLRRSLRERSSSKGRMAAPSATKVENSFLSPLVEGEGAITVTTTTTLSPQKSMASFITPHNRRKKLFTNTPANEVKY